ncbi:MAG TPA: threonine/serine exporter family protein [Xanthomonadaceae bacterium]|nr:threonine/serine exporter family protein [Xanthomonadaceae bacterium]
MASPVASTAFDARTAFVVELGARLHAYGTTAQRLEGALMAVARPLGLRCEAWSNPTGLILSFSDDAQDPQDSVTRVIRLPPGETDLSKLCAADRIAEEVIAGSLDVARGHAALRALDRMPRRRWRTMQVLGFGLAAAAVAGLLRLPWLDIATAGVSGLLIGLLDLAARSRPQMKEAGEALAAMLAAGIAIGVASLLAPLNLNTVIIASLIVLLPGMGLTNAVNELTSQHLVSGTARFAGALSTILKLTIGAMLAHAIAHVLGLEPQVRAARPQPDWVWALALAAGAYAFAVLLRAHRRDYPLVMAAAASGYLIAHFADRALGVPAGVFLSALVIAAAGNLFARMTNRPGALIRVPGIVMLVPGSASLRGLMDLLQPNGGESSDALIGVLRILLALVAGLLFGNLLIPARRNL